MGSAGRYGNPSGAGARASWKRTFWASLLFASVLVGSLLPYVGEPTELVRLRNALLYDPVPADASWTPLDVPASYLIETASPHPEFSRIVEQNHLGVAGDDWATALRIGRHLLARVDSSVESGPIQRDLRQTYRRITDFGEGYCGDFVDAFTALATTAGVFSRAWAFSFDGYGGHGHVLNEIWDRKSSQWRLIDVFNNFYVVDHNERPLSALEFRAALLRGDPIRWRPISPSPTAGYRYVDKALDYYRRGAPEWYLWWGNNVFAYDGNPVLAAAGRVSRSLQQFLAVVADLHPTIRAIHEDANLHQRSRLARVKVHLLTVLVLTPALLLLAVVSLVAGRRCPREP